MRATPHRLWGLALAVALVVSGCSSVSDTRAASVNGATISAEALRSELMTIRANQPYREILEEGLARQGLDMTVSGDGKGSFDTTFAARLLSLSVYFELLEQETLSRGVPVTDADLEQNRPQAVASVGGDQIFEAFPVTYQDELVRRQALAAQIQELVAPPPSPEELRAVYEANPGDFTGVCVSHIFANAPERGEEGARARIEDLARQLDEGADFRVLAREQSDDPVAAPQAGSLGCGGPGRFIPDFERAVEALPVGQVSEPVQSSIGFHLILVESRAPLPFEEVQSQVAETLEQQRADDFGAFVDELTCEADVDVNPRYGSWTAACDDPQVAGAIVPPDGPVTPLPPAGDPDRPADPSLGR